MPEVSSVVDLGPYRGYLLLLARSIWSPEFRSRADPSDLVHEALLEAHQEMSEGNVPDDLLPWLRQILRNTAVDLFRANRRAKRDIAAERSIDACLDASSARLGTWLADDLSSPSGRAEKLEELNRLADALRQLPAEQEQVVVLRYLQGLAVADIARQLVKTVPAVAGLLRRGLDRLRQSMNEAES